MKDLWGENVPGHRRKRKVIPLPPHTPYSITGGNDCEIIGHTLSVWDLAGCSVCLDCGVRIFCPGCITAHRHDADAVPTYCERHEASKVSA